MNKVFLGKWRITEMDLCDPEHGYIKFNPDGNGEFEFGAVSCHMTCGHSETIVHFKFEGSAECDEVFGDGWVELDEDSTDTMTGCFEFWNGDEFEFRARKL